MTHLAIMNKQLGLIDEILSGRKTIESRWYKNKICPWDRINAGDTVYFKDSGAPVTAKATVSKVLQFTELNQEKFTHIVETYGDAIALRTREYNDYYQSKNYCVLVFLQDHVKVKPFRIDKKGYGTSAAWLCIEDIKDIAIT